MKSKNFGRGIETYRGGSYDTTTTYRGSERFNSPFEYEVTSIEITPLSTPLSFDDEIESLIGEAERIKGLSLEDKLILSHEEPTINYLNSTDIKEIVDRSMSALPFDYSDEELAILYDIIYDAIVETMNRTQVRKIME